jgi:hypothetical protein
MESVIPSVTKLITATGLTPEQTAILFDINQMTVHHWLSGSARPDLSVLLLLTIIAKHGIKIIATEPLANRFFIAKIEQMVKDGHGLSAICRQLGCNYGMAGRLVEQIRLSAGS